jgi:hypothetical protein
VVTGYCLIEVVTSYCLIEVVAKAGLTVLPSCSKRDVTSSNIGGNAWHTFTRYGTVSRKNSTLLPASNTVNRIKILSNLL